VKTYVIHATYRYVTKQKETGETYSAQSRPTLSIEASSEKAAINKARKQMKERTGSAWWPVISDHLSADLVRVI
jgi:hypothetical protein